MHRSPRSLLWLALAAILVTACGGFQSHPGDGIAVRIDPVAVTLNPQGTAEFRATVTRADNAEVDWSASGGSIAGTGATVSYTAPADAGEYEVTATSADDPTKSATAIVTVEPADTARIEIVSDPVLLPGVDETATLEAVVYAADGSIDDGASVAWTSNDPSEVQVDEAGVLTAMVDAGFVTVTASHQDLPPARIDVAVATPLPATRIVPSDQVLAVEPGGTTATLARTGSSEGLGTGDLIVSDAGLLSRVQSADVQDDAVVVQLEPATLAEAFERVVIDGTTEPLEFETTFDDATMSVRSASGGLAPQAFPLGALTCETTVGVGVEVALTGASFTVRNSPTAAFTYDSGTGVLEIGFRDAPTLEGTLGTVSISGGGDVGVSCGMELAPVALPLASFWGLVSLTGDIVPKVGFEVGAAYEATALEIAGPSVTAGVSFEAGLRYEEATDIWSTFGDVERQFELGWTPLDRTLSHDLSLYAGPFVGMDFGLSGRVAIYSLVGVEVLEPKLSAGATATLPLGDRYASSYAGPGLSLGSRLGVGVKLELTGGVADALARFGVDNVEVGIASFDLYSIEEDVTPRPSVDVSTTSVTESVTVSASSALSELFPGLEDLVLGRSVEFVAFTDGASTGTVIGSDEVDAFGQADITWTPDAADDGDVTIVALLYDGAFGAIARPIRSLNRADVTVDVGGGPTDPSASGFVGIAGGPSHSLALDADGNAWAWGAGEMGQLGNGQTVQQDTPTAVTMPTGVTFVDVDAGGSTSLALDDAGRAWAWGENFGGSLGVGPIVHPPTPEPVLMPDGIPFASISAGLQHMLALDADGAAWSWGSADNGVLGNDTAYIATEPAPVDSPEGVTFTDVSAGHRHSLALDPEGRAWAWGDGADGRLGDGSSAVRATPATVAMPGGVAFVSVEAGGLHSLALDVDGRAWAWGGNYAGALGTGDQADRDLPTLADMPADVTFVDLHAGFDYSLALDTAGNVWAWGANFEGYLGTGDTTLRTAPTLIAMPAGTSFDRIGGGMYHSLAIDSGGNAWSWGNGGNGRLGLGGSENHSSPQAVVMP